MADCAIIGAGPIGRGLAERLVRAGRRVAVATRSLPAGLPEGADHLQVDAADAERLAEAVEEASVVFHCAAPPYERQARDFPALTSGVLEAATLLQAKLVVADNLHAYGPKARQLSENLPARPEGPLGTVRAAMAEQLLEAHCRGDAPVCIVRAADFFGPGIRFSIAGEQLFGPAVEGGTIRALGRPEAWHSYTYAPDFVAALATLAEEPDAYGEIWHAPNDDAVTNRQFVEKVVEAAGGKATIRWVSRPVEALARLWNPTLRALKETAYQRNADCIALSRKIEQRFGLKATPLDEAIAATVAWYRERG